MPWGLGLPRFREELCSVKSTKTTSLKFRKTRVRPRFLFKQHLGVFFPRLPEKGEELEQELRKDVLLLTLPFAPELVLFLSPPAC